MLVIRQAQLEAFAQARRRDFITRGAAYLREFHAPCCGPYGEEEARKRMEEGFARAARYGLGTERQVIQFLDFMCELGSDFDTRLAWASSSLNAPHLSANGKLSALRQERRMRIHTEGDSVP